MKISEDQNVKACSFLMKVSL